MSRIRSRVIGYAAFIVDFLRIFGMLSFVGGIVALIFGIVLSHSFERVVLFDVAPGLYSSPREISRLANAGNDLGFVTYGAKAVIMGSVLLGLAAGFQLQIKLRAKRRRLAR